MNGKSFWKPGNKPATPYWRTRSRAQEGGSRFCNASPRTFLIDRLYRIVAGGELLSRALDTCTHSLTYVHTSPYTFTLLVCSANQLCLGRLAYRGNLFGLDERVTEKVKRGFAFRMRSNVLQHICGMRIWSRKRLTKTPACGKICPDLFY